MGLSMSTLLIDPKDLLLEKSDNKIESILNWCGYETGKELGRNLQGITKPIRLKKHGTTFGMGYEYTWKEFDNWSPPWRGPYNLLKHPMPCLEQNFQLADIIYGSEEEEVLAAMRNLSQAANRSNKSTDKTKAQEVQT
uniref:G-patch domain-containing protein n=1 Tax=Nicotiana tabacum TaxID=4097 RepID=A0A1S4AJC9_TOBAC|nr:PREDICTED: uncharacterized protein LOC107798261 [Nicotiana tabacum]